MIECYAKENQHDLSQTHLFQTQDFLQDARHYGRSRILAPVTPRQPSTASLPQEEACNTRKAERTSYEREIACQLLGVSY